MTLTSWNLLGEAARGSPSAREAFYLRYEPVAAAYLGARWRGSPLHSELDDCVQDLFVECFREHGVLDRVDPHRAGGFRAYLFGALQKMALHRERTRANRARKHVVAEVELTELPADDERLSRVFDRAWAMALMQEAMQQMKLDAARNGAEAEQRVELLRLRFEEDLPIRAIAKRWDADPDALHRAYAKAREEFRRCLRDVVGCHVPNSESGVEQECRRLLSFFD